MVVITLVYLILMVLINKPGVMLEHTAGRWRNAFLLTGLLLSLGLAVHKVPQYYHLLTA